MDITTISQTHKKIDEHKEGARDRVSQPSPVSAMLTRSAEKGASKIPIKAYGRLDSRLTPYVKIKKMEVVNLSPRKLRKVVASKGPAEPIPSTSRGTRSAILVPRVKNGTQCGVPPPPRRQQCFR